MPCVRRPSTPSPSFPTHTLSPYIIIPHGIPPTPSPSNPHTPTQTPPTLYPNTIPPTPSPSIHHHHTPAPTPSTHTPSPLSKDPVQLPPVGHGQPPHGSLDSLLPSEARCPIVYPGVAGRRKDREPPTGWVQVGGAEEALCPASSHSSSWRAAQPAQDTSP